MLNTKPNVVKVIKFVVGGDTDDGRKYHLGKGSQSYKHDFFTAYQYLFPVNLSATFSFRLAAPLFSLTFAANLV